MGCLMCETQRTTAPSHRIFELTTLLIEDRPFTAVLDAILAAVLSIEGVESVALLLPEKGELRLVGSAGRPFSPSELQPLTPRSGRPVRVGFSGPEHGGIRVLSLSAPSGPVGLVLLRGSPPADGDREVLQTFLHHAAIAVERQRLRAEALRSETLARTDELRGTLLAAVAHDLSGPLACMKVVTSSVCSTAATETEGSAHELLTVLDSQVDRLGRLVSGLLDLSRSEGGVLRVRPEIRTVGSLLRQAASVSTAASEGRKIVVEVSDHRVAVEADPLLINQVLANLIDNAHRYGPPGSPITLAARVGAERVELSVADMGPGLPEHSCSSVFDPFVRRGSGGRAGLGLAIARTFVEAHGETIWAENTSPCGTRVTFTLLRADGRPRSVPAPTAGRRGDHRRTATSAAKPLATPPEATRGAKEGQSGRERTKTSHPTVVDRQAFGAGVSSRMSQKAVMRSWSAR